MQKLLSATLFFTAILAPAVVQAEPKNEMVGVWRLVSAMADPDGKKIAMFGDHGSGLLIFTSDLHYVTYSTTQVHRSFNQVAA